MSEAIITKSKRRTGKGRSRRAKTPGDSIGKYADDAWSLAQRTARGLNEIRRFINIETKFSDVILNITFSNSGALTVLSETAQGLTSTTRVGDSIRLQSFEFRGTAKAVSSSAPDTIRFIILRDLDGYGTAPGVTDVLEAANAWSPYKFNKLQRFQILFDELATVDLVTKESVLVVYKSAINSHIKYLGTTAAAASDGKGTIYLLTISNNASNQPVFTGVSRMTYTDD